MDCQLISISIDNKKRFPWPLWNGIERAPKEREKMRRRERWKTVSEIDGRGGREKVKEDRERESARLVTEQRDKRAKERGEGWPRVIEKKTVIPIADK